MCWPALARAVCPDPGDKLQSHGTYGRVEGQQNPVVLESGCTYNVIIPGNFSTWEMELNVVVQLMSKRSLPSFRKVVRGGEPRIHSVVNGPSNAYDFISFTEESLCVCTAIFWKLA
jgi:hypothetical protein